MQKIYLLSVKEISENVGRVKAILPAFSVAKSERYADKTDEHRSLGAALLIKAFTAESPLLCSENGKPYKAAPPFFNASHTDDKVGIFISDESKVGFDVQRIKEYNEKLAEYAFSEEEKRLIKDGVSFTKLWTMKESAAKLTGEGIRNAKRQAMTEITENSFIFGGKKVYYETFLTHKYALTASSYKPISAKITEITVNEIIK